MFFICPFVHGDGVLFVFVSVCIGHHNIIMLCSVVLL